MRKTGCLLAVLLLGCAPTAPPAAKRCTAVPCTTTKTATREATPKDPAASGSRQNQRNLARGELSPAKSPKPEPPWASQLSANCQGKLAFTEEVTRLLVKAAAHATRSSACVDGPGERVVVDQILVCPGRINKARALLYARYLVTRTREGDTRMCGRLPSGCSWTKPVATFHHAAFEFSAHGRGYRILLPSKVPGLEDATPLSKSHNGGCYGKSGPFVPRTVASSPQPASSPPRSRTWSKERSCHSNRDCVIEYDPCGYRLLPCGDQWKPAINRAADRRKRANWAIKKPACDTQVPCKDSRGRWLGSRAVCIRGQCAARQ